MGDAFAEEIPVIAEEAQLKAAAVAVHDFASGADWHVNGDRWFHAASTIKVAILVALAAAVAEGRFQLSSRLAVRNRFLSAADGLPFRIAAARDANAEVHRHIGRTMRLDELAGHMIATSSNLATNLLVDLVGVGYARAVLARIGVEGVDLRRGVEGVQPIPHTTRRGWLARADCYPRNPFTTDIDDPVWTARYTRHDAPDASAPASLRQIAQRIFHRFRLPIARVSDPLTFRLIGAVLSGRAPSLLDLPERPPGYDDVGRLCGWDKTLGASVARSRYERVLIRALSGTPLRIGADVLTPLGTRGWMRIVFRREPDGARQTMSLDALLPHLEAWERRT